jgi:hypothetical protein
MRCNNGHSIAGNAEMTDTSRGKLRHLRIALGVGCLALALLLRLSHPFASSFDFDEVYELNHLHHSVVTIAQDSDGFPPLYRWFLAGFVGVFGEPNARYFSLLTSSLSLLSLGYIFYRWSNKTISSQMWTALLFASLWPHEIVFAQQARAYSLLILWAIWAIYFSIELQAESNPRNWVGVVGFVWLGIGTHYLFAIAGLLLWALLLFPFSRVRFVQLIVAGLVLSVLCIPWIVCLKIDLQSELPQDAVNRVDWTGIAYSYFSLLSGWTLGPSPLALQEMSREEGIVRILPWFALTSFAMLSFAPKIWEQRAKSIVWMNTLLILISPIFVALVSYATGTSFANRYVAWLAAPILLLLGNCFEWNLKTFSGRGTWLILGILSIANFNRIVDHHYDRDNFRELTAFLKERGEDGSPILIVSHYYAAAVEREIKQNYPQALSRLIALGIKSDEPDDWDAKTADLKKSKTASEIPVLIVARLTPAKNSFYEHRARKLTDLNAIRVALLSNNIEVFEGRIDNSER